MKKYEIKGFYTAVLMSHISIAGCTVFRIDFFKKHGINAQVFLCAIALLAVIMALLIVADVLIFATNFKKLNRITKAFLIAMTLVLAILCPAKDGVMSVKDLVQGTETFSTQYYTAGAKPVLYKENVQVSPAVNKKQYRYIRENLPEINPLQSLNVGDWVKISAHTRPLSIQYYPNTMLASDVKYEEK